MRSSASDDGDDVDRLAALEQLEHRLEDLAVRLAVEVRGPQELGDLDDRVAVDEDRAEHRLLGLEALGRQAIDHGHLEDGGGLCHLECHGRRACPIGTYPRTSSTDSRRRWRHGLYGASGVGNTPVSAARRARE